MVNKEVLKQLFRSSVQADKDLLNHIINGDEAGANRSYYKIEELDGKFDYASGGKYKMFDERLESVLGSYRCNESAMDSYIEEENVGNLYRCLGITESAGLDLIDTMF